MSKPRKTKRIQKRRASRKLFFRGGAELDLINAIMNRNTDKMRNLIAQGANVNLGDENNLTPLMLACMNSHELSVNILIDAGARVNEETIDDGSTALMIASRYGNLPIVRRLLDAGARINAETIEDNHTALTWASLNDNNDVIHELIQRGANVNHPLASGTTSLMLASLNGNLNAVDELIQGGAHVNRIDGDHRRAIDYTDNEEIRELLLANGSENPEQFNNQGAQNVVNRLNISGSPHIGNLYLDLNGYLNPITQEPFEPNSNYVRVRKNNRHIFDQDTLQQWFNTGVRTSPKTRNVLGPNNLEIFTYRRRGANNTNRRNTKKQKVA
jgi:ankyrin repeat protein